MPRQARLCLPGIPWHIIQRGNNRSACFYSDDDFRRYLDILAEQAGKFGCQVHAYVLMTNHVHLLLTPKEPDSGSLLMKHLGQRYVQYFNRTHQRSGTLWEGRFRSSLVESERYALACYRYIELNPVRANMVRHPREYPWSSYRVNAEGRRSSFISPHGEFQGLGITEQSRRKAYRALFRKTLDPRVIEDIRCSTNGNFALGGSRFKGEVEARLERRVSPGRAGRPVQPD
jgi:putative transposase